MKYLVVFLIFIFSVSIFAQEKKNEKIYEFDYFLEYTSTGGECMQDTCKSYTLINSKDNTYIIYMRDIENDSLAVFFKEFDEIHGRGRILKEDFIKPDTLDLKCAYYRFNEYSYSSSIPKDLVYIKLKDTAISGKDCIKYGIVSEKKLKRKRKKNKELKIDSFFVFEEDNAFEKPNVGSIFGLRRWDRSNIKKKGLIIYNYTKLKRNRSLYKDIKRKLINYSKFKKALKINLDCE